MDTFKVQVELPRDLLLALNIPTNEIEKRTREWIALELFREGVVSSGKAAELLGLSKVQFLDLLDQHGIPYLDLSPAELAQQIESALAASNKSQE